MAKKRKLAEKPAPVVVAPVKEEKRKVAEKPAPAMAKKRKLAEKPAPAKAKKRKLAEKPAPVVVAPVKEEKQKLKLAETAAPVVGSPVKEEPQEEQPVEEEEEQQTNFEVDEEMDAADGAVEDDDDDSEEPFQKLIEPFTKSQLSDLLREASEKHSDVLDSIRKLADVDPVHRKIFVHGLSWDTNAETLISGFKQYGEIEVVKLFMIRYLVNLKVMVLFCLSIGAELVKLFFFLIGNNPWRYPGTYPTNPPTRGGKILFGPAHPPARKARKALKEPQKKIGNRMTACQLASSRPVPAPAPAAPPVSEYTQRKIYVSNVSADIDPQKLLGFFAKFGEIEEGPLGLDKQSGKPKGFSLFVYRSPESARKALEEPRKNFEGHILHCQKAIDGPKPNKPYFNQPTHSAGGGDDHGSYEIHLSEARIVHA